MTGKDGTKQKERSTYIDRYLRNMLGVGQLDVSCLALDNKLLITDGSAHYVHGHAGVGCDGRNVDLSNRRNESGNYAQLIRCGSNSLSREKEERRDTNCEAGGNEWGG